MSATCSSFLDTTVLLITETSARSYDVIHVASHVLSLCYVLKVFAAQRYACCRLVSVHLSVCHVPVLYLDSRGYRQTSFSAL